jgi:serine/threonine-protein kinase RsbT
MPTDRPGDADETLPPGLTHAVIPISSAADIVTARQRGRALAEKIGFIGSDLTVIATAISELARNILEYAKTGEVVLSLGQKGSRVGIAIVARDTGPGIPDLSKALQDGYTTGRGLGLGLPGVRRLVDEFEISSEVGRGTTVIVRKWVP